MSTYQPGVFSSRFVAITYDSWTSLSHHCYLTLTGHFLLENQVQRCMLSFLECSESHTSDDISNLIKDTLKSVYKDIQIVGCVSDNAYNMVATAQKLNFEHIGCIIHSIQLVIRDALVDSAPKVLKDQLSSPTLAQYHNFDELVVLCSISIDINSLKQ